MHVRFVTSPACWAARLHPLGSLKLVKPGSRHCYLSGWGQASACGQTKAPKHGARQLCRVDVHVQVFALVVPAEMYSQSGLHSSALAVY